MNVTFLTFAEVVLIHCDQMTRYGGAAGIRDTALLKSAVAMPEAAFGGKMLHKSLFEIEGLCKDSEQTPGRRITALTTTACFVCFVI